MLEHDESIPQPAIRYGDIGQRIPVLTAVNWSQHLCAILSAMCAISGCSWASKLARKCEIKHWFPCGADGRTVGGRCTVTWLPIFFGWVDYLSYETSTWHLDTWPPEDTWYGVILWVLRVLGLAEKMKNWPKPKFFRCRVDFLQS